MGRNRVIKTLGKRIGNVVLHKLLIKYTNRSESKIHLESEEIEYRNAAIKDAKLYHWNSKDKQIIKLQAIDFIKDKLIKKYDDINFPLSEAEVLLDKEMKNLRL